MPYPYDFETAINETMPLTKLMAPTYLKLTDWSHRDAQPANLDPSFPLWPRWANDNVLGTTGPHSLEQQLATLTVLAVWYAVAFVVILALSSAPFVALFRWGIEPEFWLSKLFAAIGHAWQRARGKVPDSAEPELWPSWKPRKEAAPVQGATAAMDPA